MCRLELARWACRESDEGSAGEAVPEVVRIEHFADQRLVARLVDLRVEEQEFFQVQFHGLAGLELKFLELLLGLLVSQGPVSRFIAEHQNRVRSRGQVSAEIADKEASRPHLCRGLVPVWKNGNAQR